MGSQQVTETPAHLRGIRMWIAGAVLVASMLVCSRATAADADRTLLYTYAPALRVDAPRTPCADGNGHLPIAVESVIGNRQVALVGPGAARHAAPSADVLAAAAADSALDLPGTPRRDGCTERRWEASLIAAGTQRTAYARVVRDPDAPNTLYTQYWFFLLTNDWETPHEGDWEMIQLTFPTGDAARSTAIGPTEATYAQHADAETIDWSDVDRANGGHPLVWIARGSNAAEFGEGVFLRAADGCDVTSGAGTTLAVPITIVPTDHADAVRAFPWLAFRGRWGTSTSTAPSPVGPAFHTQWTAPWRWTRSVSRASVRVPSRGLLAGAGAGALCTTVAATARQLRRMDAVPSGSRAAFAGALLLTLILITLRAWIAVRRHGTRVAVLAPVAGATIGLGILGGLVQWVSGLFAVGAFSVVTDTVATLAALIVPAVTVLLLGAAAVSVVSRRDDITASAAATLRHPLRTWRASPAHRRPRALITMLGVALVTVVLSRVAAIAVIMQTGWPFWTAMPIASCIDALLVGGALMISASRRAGASPPPVSATPTPV